MKTISLKNTEDFVKNTFSRLWEESKMQETEMHRGVEIKMVNRDNSFMKLDCEGDGKGLYQELDMGSKDEAFKLWSL